MAKSMQDLVGKFNKSIGDGVVAYFTPEIGIHQSLPIYSGGLGILADSMSKAAYQSGLPFVVVSLLYRRGYYDQVITYNDELRKEWMGISYTARAFDDVLTDCGLVSVHLGENGGSEIHLRIWRSPAGIYGSSEVLLLDADIEENPQHLRMSTYNLYAAMDQGGTPEQRIVQDIILGIGGWKALRKLGFDPKICHLNEGYPWPAIVAQMQECMDQGLTFEQAEALARGRTIFTTHTPVEAGNKKWPYDDVIRLLDDDRFNKLLYESAANPSRGFNLTEFCLKHSHVSYAVSEKHAEVARDMWKHLPQASKITHVTNGQDVQFWQHEDFARVSTWEELARVKLHHKRILLQYIKEVSGKYFDEGILLIGFGRRFANYKRPNLILDDLRWLAAQMNDNRLRVVFGGKPHPEDRRMVQLWSDILHLSSQLHGIVILPGYEIDLMKLMKNGTDVWLNNPEPPREASGTSGMGAAFNGTINFSTIDGWMVEEFKEAPDCFFPFGVSEIGNWDQQWIRDSESMRVVFSEKVRPMYRHNKEEWYTKALKAKQRAEVRWSSLRMLADCITNIYTPTLKAVL